MGKACYDELEETRMADAIGADLFEIRPEVLYTSADLNWRDVNARSTIEMKAPSSRPMSLR